MILHMAIRECVCMYVWCRLEITENSSAHPEAVNISPPSPPVTSHDPAVPPIPEYEEIKDVRQARRHAEGGHNPRIEDSNTSSGVGGEHALREYYEFTKCPAYAVTSSTA